MLQRNPTRLLIVLLSMFATLAMADEPDDSGPPTETVIGHLEREDDPPGIPALPVPGAPPAYQPRVGRNVSHQVNVDANGANIPGDAANEPSIAVDPTSPNHIAIGWRQFDTISSNFRQAGIGFSADGGRTWTFPGVLDPGRFRSDPVLDFDSNGAFYYNSLESNMTTDVFTSLDGGETWGAPEYAYGGDKQWMTIDRSGGIGEGHIYSAWSDFYGCCGDNMHTRATDGGGSFEYPTTMSPRPHWGSMDVGPSGAAYIAGLDGGLNNFMVAKSENAQDENQSPTFTTTTFNMGGSVAYFGGPNPGGLLGQTWVAVDPSTSPPNEHVYVLCSVDPPGSDPMDVHFVRSTNGGASWSAPVRVNDDSGTSAWQWFGTMDVGPNGRIDAIWNDTRGSGSSNVSELYYSFSTDGGVTWSQNERLSPSWNSHLGWPQQDKIGDYYEMVSDAVGAHLAWAATFNGEQDVYYLRIGDYDCNSNGVGDSLDIAHGTSSDHNENGIPDECEDGPVDVPEIASMERLLRVSPNPTDRMTTIDYVVSDRRARVRLQIFDVEGRAVRTLINGFAPGGTNSVTWDGKDGLGRLAAPGVYFARLETRRGVMTQRVQLIR